MNVKFSIMKRNSCVFLKMPDRSKRIRKRPLYNLLSLCLFVLCVNTLSAQTSKKITVNGNVVDEDGLPLVGATIVQQNTSRATIADFDGNFSLKIDNNSNIEVMYTGYITQVIKNVTGANVISIKMEPDVNSLDEVVVVGFTTQTKQTLVGAVDTVDGEELKQVGSVSTVSEALQGLAPGVTVLNTNGKPGADAPDIFLRGISSWNGSGAPLTLVDGVPRDFNNVDPNEIETISILKDATATAVYGVRGANGVILITTKKGKRGKPQFNFSANLGIKQPTAKPEFADYLTAQKLYNEAAANDQNWEQIIPESTITAWEENYDQRGPYNPYFPEVDWVDEVFGTGYEQTYNLNVRGGSKLVRYFTSLGYRNDGDIFKTTPNEDYDPEFRVKRYNWRSNLDFDFTPTTKLSVSFSGNYRERKQPGYRIDGNGEDGFGQAQFFNLLYSSPRNLFPIRDEDGFYGDSSNGESNVIMALNEGGTRTYEYFQGFYDAEITQGLDFITKGLSFKGSANYSSASSYEKRILRGGLGSANVGIIRYYRDYDYSNPLVAEDGTVTYPVNSEIRYPNDQSQGTTVAATSPRLISYFRKYNYKAQLDYKRVFGDHTISSNAIFWRQYHAVRSAPAQKREEWIGRLNYYYKKRYLIEANTSYSGSEQFSPNKRFGHFYSAALGWVISEEPFVQKLAGDWLNLFKVNYSYGKSGSDYDVAITNYDQRFQYVQSYSTAGNVNFGLDNFTAYGPRYVEGSLANDNSTWEESTVHNLAFKVDAFDKLSMSLDLYRESRTGILMDVRLPSYAGIADLALGNIGETKKHGYEFQVGWKDKIGDVSYGLNFNTAFTENRVVFRDDPILQDEYINMAGKPINRIRRIIASNLYQSLDDIYNGPSLGLASTKGSLVPGDVMFLDYDGNGVIDGADAADMENTTKLPLRTYGLRFNVGYKNFSLSTQFYGVTNKGVIIPNNYYFGFINGVVQGGPDIVNRWTEENSETETNPALHLNNSHNTTNSSLTYADASYIRLKSAEFKYRFNKSFIKKASLNSLELYINGNNLFTWSKLDDQIDPEAGGANNYPIVKRFGIGLRAGF